MKNKLTLVILMLLVLINAALVSTTNSYAESNTPLENMKPGDKIIFTDKEWIILDPSVGYIILASNDGNKKWNTNRNNDYASSDIRNYLNGEFLNNLGEENEDLIMEVIWNCGPERLKDQYFIRNHRTYEEVGNIDVSGETSKKVRDKVGLLTYSEYVNYSKYYNQNNGGFLDLNGEWWVLTPYFDSPDSMWYVRKDDHLPDGFTSTSDSIGVYPALYLKSELFVSTVTYDGNDSNGGTVPTGRNNHLVNTTVTVLDNTGALTKANHTFAGWNTAIDGSGKDYTAGETLTMGNANVTLYAKWTADSTDAVLSASTATFDKNVDNQTDVSITMTLNGNTLTAIKNGGSTLTEITDYTVVGNTVTIKKEYLKDQPLGNIDLTFDFSWGTDPTLTITIEDTTVNNSSISPMTAGFDKKITNQADVSVTMTLNGNTLTAIKNGGSPLTENTDYTVSGDTVTIKKEYLADQAVGDVELTFDFSRGIDPSLTITVTDTTQSASNNTTITSTLYIVNTTNKTITNVPYGTIKSDFQDNISKGHIGQT